MEASPFGKLCAACRAWLAYSDGIDDTARIISMGDLEAEVDQVLKTLVREMEVVLRALHRGARDIAMHPGGARDRPDVGRT
jgi:hypothetical protein